jgi:hypothetical protein
MNKENIVIALLIVVIALLAVPMLGGSDSDVLAGAGCNSGNCTDFDAVNTSAGYYVDDSQVIDGSGDFVGAISTSDSVSVGTFTQGGGVTATITPATATFVAADFDTESLVEIYPPAAGATLTMMSSTTFPLSTTAGSMREIAFFNATGTSGINVTLTRTSTGVHIVGSTTATTTSIVLAPRAMSVLTAIRLTSGDIIVTKNP